MATVKIIKRHSGKKYKKKKVASTPKKEAKDKDGADGIVPRRAKKVYPSHEKKLVYTYVLKDILKNIYKVGKTTNPHARFKSLCKRGRVMPVALVKKDIEDIIHKRYAENRIFNEEYRYNGATEWFKPGGKFDEFLTVADKGVFLPYITVHTMTMELIEHNVIQLSDSSTEWELSQSAFGYYMIGLEVLKMLGYIKKAGRALVCHDNMNILMIGQKISVSDAVVDLIKKDYKVYISHTACRGLISENIDRVNKESRLRKISIESDDFDAEVYLLLNRVLS